MFSEVVGCINRKAVSYSILKKKKDCFVFIVALEDIDQTNVPIHHLRIAIDRKSGKIDPFEAISLASTELAAVIRRATRN